ncbi:hypothetical protein IFM89_002585, partial [Coptis chinensis]
EQVKSVKERKAIKASIREEEDTNEVIDLKGDVLVEVFGKDKKGRTRVVGSQILPAQVEHATVGEYLLEKTLASSASASPNVEKELAEVKVSIASLTNLLLAHIAPGIVPPQSAMNTPHGSNSPGLYLMEENKQSQSGDKKKEDPKPEGKVVVGGGWGGWGLARFSVLSDLQKVATLAAEKLSRNAIEVAKNAAKGIGDMQNTVLDSESPKKEEEEAKQSDDDDELRKSTLDKFEKAS